MELGERRTDEPDASPAAAGRPVAGAPTDPAATAAAAAAAAVEAERNLLAEVFRRSPSFMAVLRGPRHVFELANDLYYQLVGHRDLIGKPVREALPEMAGQGFFELLDAVYATGEPFVGRDKRLLVRREPGAPAEERRVDVVYQALRGADGAVTGVFAHGVDLTDYRRAEAAARAGAERYRTLFDSIDQGFCVIQMLFDVDGRPVDYRFLEANPAFERQTGLVDAVGRTARELVPALEDRWFAAYGRVALTGEPVRFEDSSDPMGRWFDVYAFRTGEPSGRRVAILFKDVTEAKRAEAALRESERRFREMADAAPAILWVCEPDGRCTFLSRGWYELTGQTEAEGLGFGWTNAAHPDDRAAAGDAFVAANAARRAYAVDFRVRRADGEYRWVLDAGRPRFGPDGEFLGLVGSVIDITDRKLAADALRESEQRFRLMADAVPQIVWITDHEGRVLFFNQQWFAYTGLPDAPRTAADAAAGFVHPDDRAATMAAFDEARRTGGPFRVDHRIRSASGEYRWFAVRAEPFRDPDTGAITRWYGASTDIADRRRAEDALRESEARLLLAVAIAQIGTFEIDLRTDAVAVNEVGREIYGWAPGEPLTFAKVQGHFHPADRDAVLRAVGDAFRPDGPGEFDVAQRIVRADGAVRWIRVRGRAIFAGEGAGRAAVRCVGTYLDVTGDKEAARQREELLEGERAARAEAERASRIKDEFLATLSHELRTPLNAILGWSQILRTGGGGGGGGPAAEDLDEGLATIERNARAQTQIIDDLLDMSRIISGKVRLDVQRLDLAAVVRASVDTIRPAADAKGVRLSAVLDPAAGPVSGDPNRLQQVFWNLLSNAVKFTPRGGRVQVLLERVDSHVEVSVIDTGMGVAPTFLPHVFDRFRQADSSTTRQHGGLGLGLSIVKQLVELHGGTVRARSAGLGHGTTFTVDLPLVVVHPEPDEPADPDRRHPAAAGMPADLHREACAQLDGVRVLVVDDEPDARALVKRLLSDCGAVVQVASSAAEAMAAFAVAPPDVLVSDIGMPKVDGYALMRQVRALAKDKGGNTPSLALTAYARPEDRMRAVRAGFHLHVVKPVEPVELVTMVAALAERVGG